MKKCKSCHGTGAIDIETWGDKGFYRSFLRTCDKCHGTGKVSQTNQDWLQHCKTEPLAEKLTDFAFWLMPELPAEERRKEVKDKILAWLRCEHNE